MSTAAAPHAAPAVPLPPLLWLFAACNFVIGTGAFGMTGYLGPVAEGLGVSISAAGQTMTVYALANAVLAPLLMAATARWPRASVMRLALALFTAGTLLSAAAPHWAVLMMGRVLMGAGAVFTPIAAGVAVQLAAPAQRGQALSRTFLGMSLSYVLGMPYGAWLGLQWGWRWPLLGVGVAALVIGIVLHRQLRAGPATGGTSLRGTGALLRRRDVVLTLLFTLLYFTGIFVVTAYMGPVQLALNPLTPGALSTLLAGVGVAGVVGTLLGGWAADRLGPRRTLALLVGCLLLAMVAVPLSAGHLAWTAALFAVWNLCGFGLMSPQQSRLAEQAGPQAPLLLSLNASMVYIGTALGSAIGGAAIAWVGLTHLAWLAAVFVAAALWTLAVHPARAQPPTRTTVRSPS
ncbi:Purine efflux pump PbuE [Tepidimonas thermarum]|uniref:Purine efflux pump PbuE n=1 Tax=Tepidimonas thermarum TaxID=335431 RepID=A0A554WXQ3_9BURK|nr:MFS transporter [Tepidimonas thermarum]TSE28349.1 Purine efflux pump PbuE [Tepidimonas thermarum]